ncbi:MAG: aldose 1-epimerase family protein [Ruminococcaceae bacterium]|nr:aldose 1-epimerase family protein [Oscillospiraceae bacterium]
MDNCITLKNDCLTVLVSPLGAELKSIIKDNTQRLWQGDPRWWNGQAPLLFPICGCLSEGRYLHKGVSYDLPMHGFGRRSVFEVESADNTKAVFLLKSDVETLKVYPFEFELRVIYELKENRISITYVVINKTDGEMYFSVGSHEAYNCEGKTEDYEMFFENNEPLVNYLLDGPLLNGKTENMEYTNGALTFTDEKFKELDTYIFLNTESKKVTLKKKGSDKSISVEFSGIDNLLIWKEPGSEFFCIEPWCGLPDYVGEVKEISQKPAINKLEKNAVFQQTHTIIID